jgi:hypothetical protein
MRLTPDQIKLGIAAKEIDAVTLDTSIFDATNISLEHGALARLRQFHGSDVDCVLSDVVVGEIRKHLTESAASTQAAVKRSLRDVDGAWAVGRQTRDQALASLFGDESPAEMAERRLQKFFEHTGIGLVESNGLVDVGRLVRDYFEQRAPFGTTSDKKAEFPDAIALQALEAWAAERGTKLIAVSKDKDWFAFAEASDWLVPVEDLSSALSYFHEDSSVICTLLSQKYAAGELVLDEMLSQALSFCIEDVGFEPEFTSGYFTESDVYEAAVRSFEIEPLSHVPEVVFKAIDRGEDYLVVEATMKVNVAVSASFTFSITDPIDKDELPMGSASATADVELEANALITFVGDLSGTPGAVEIEIEVPGNYHCVEFGDIGPDWMDEQEFEGA